ncbi:MAG: HRDC domain-containing protein [Alphaproteobacteria bacterium]|nr:HRDC domain-containing protein [Alphaproteobacteria bacterium]
MTDPRLARRHDLPELVALLRDAPRVAVDTEFHAESRYVPRLYLVQLRTDAGPTWVVDPLDRALLEGLAEPLRAVPTWVVHGGTQDLRLLERALGGVAARVHDTQVAAGLVTPVFPDGLDRLAATWLEVEVDKGPRMADWSVRPLPAEQLAYAALDVAWLLPLWDLLAARAEGLGRRDALEAACAEARAESTAPEGGAADWQRIVGEGRLDAEGVRVARRLLDWREAEACRRDRPTFFVLGDAVIRHLAKARPTTLDALAAHRRVSDKVVDRHGDELIGVIRAALGAPDDGARAIEPGSAEAQRLAFLELVAAVEGAAHALAPRLVAPSARLRELALDPSPALVADVLGPWRDALLGGALRDALSGRLALALDGGLPTARR